jgi:hypothetical protein
MFIFIIHFKFCFHRCVLYDKMNKIRSHLHMFAPCHQQYFSRHIYSSNQISNVYFLMYSFPSFDWTPAQELKMAQRSPIGLPFFFNPSDSPSPLIASPPLPSPSPLSHAKQEICAAPRLLYCTSSHYPPIISHPLRTSMESFR